MPGSSLARLPGPEASGVGPASPGVDTWPPSPAPGSPSEDPTGSKRETALGQPKTGLRGGTHSGPFVRVPPAQEAQAPSHPLQLLCVPRVRREGLSFPLILRASQPQRTALQAALNTPSARATPRPGRIDSLGVGPRHPVFGGKAAQVIPGTGEEDMRWEDRAGGKEGEADRRSDVAPEANATADSQR